MAFLDERHLGLRLLERNAGLQARNSAEYVNLAVTKLVRTK
jgi:hypothetical protein